MGQLIATFLGVAAIIVVTLGLFVGVNALVDLAPKDFGLFATLAGAVVGAVIGVIINSQGWFLGGLLWPLGGAALGALVGRLVWARHPPPAERRWRIPDRARPAIFLGPALLFLLITLVVPTLRTIYLSFRSARGEDYVGTANYRDILGDSNIFNIDSAADIFTSRLFIAGAVIGVVALAWMVIRGVSTRRGVDVTAPSPVLSLTATAILVTLAAMGALRGVVWNNIYWVVFVTGLSTIIGLAIAVLADRSRGESVAKSLIFMPMAISFVGASVIWRFVYAFTPAGEDQIGVLNAAWVGLGGEPQTWLQEAPWNSLFLIAIMIWIQTGFAMVVLSSAIKAVPTELLEAARVDGASEAQSFWRVTLPHIRSTVAVVVTTLIITVLKVYDIVKVMTNGEFATSVIANEMFDQAFILRDYGRGSVLAVILLVAVLPLMVMNIRRLRRGEQG
ncbi:MAG TPA: sugar ABC transporter permease [Acidimicrobiales bacterium]|nr:sugar ABC transporter permease [Acidimicrobiales bacterium]